MVNTSICIGASKIHLSSSGGLGCCSFKSDGSVVVGSMFIVGSIDCWGSELNPCFVMQYFVSFLVLQLS